MASIYALGKVMHPSQDIDEMGRLHRELKKILSPVKGVESSTLWQSQSSPDSFMLVSHYANEAAAEQALDLIVEKGFLERVSKSIPSPLDLVRTAVQYESGVKAGAVPMGKYMSVSDRAADPGFSEDLVDELKRIFGELSELPGFLGSAIAKSVVLDEEVMGLVFWDSVESFMSSLPLKVVYEVKLFHRIA